MTPTPITRAMREAAEKAYPNMENLIPRMKAAAQAATQGPWTTNVVDEDGECVRDANGVHIATCDYRFHDTIKPIDQSNAAHIALANPANILALLDALEEAKLALAPLAARCEDGVNPDDHDGSGLTVKVFSLRAARKAFQRIHTLSGEGK